MHEIFSTVIPNAIDALTLSSRGRHHFHRQHNDERNETRSDDDNDVDDDDDDDDVDAAPLLEAAQDHDLDE